MTDKTSSQRNEATRSLRTRFPYFSLILLSYVRGTAGLILPGAESLVGKNLQYRDELKLHVGKSGKISSGLGFLMCRLRGQRILTRTLSAEGTTHFLKGTGPT